jgi:hypothetical protein
MEATLPPKSYYTFTRTQALASDIILAPRDAIMSLTNVALSANLAHGQEIYK